MSRNRANSKQLMKVDIMLNSEKMKLFDYKNLKITAYLEISGTLRCEKWECSISLCNLRKDSLFCCVQLDPLFNILCV